MKGAILVSLLLIGATFGRKGFGPTDQEWGFVEVRDGANLFWWLHYTTANVSKYTDRPLVIWLQGGPGASSTGFGNFGEIGPLDDNLNVRNTSWVKDVNLLFVDNPVGTGYSFVNNSKAYTTTNRQIAEDFLVMLKEFYETFPEFKSVPLYIFCESYGGKMTAEIALVIDQAIKTEQIETNLVGIGLGDAWVSPIDSVLTWAPYLLYVGAIDQNGYNAIQDVAETAKSLVDGSQWEAAEVAWELAESAVFAQTGGIDFYNILTEISVRYGARRYLPGVREIDDDKINSLMQNEVRQALNIDFAWGSQSGYVFNYLTGDFMKPVTSIVEELLNTTDIKVAVYNGQLDLIVDTPGTIKWVQELSWKGKSQWDAAPRNIFTGPTGVIEGYVKSSGNLAFYWVNRAGHMVPADNTDAMHYILRDVTNNFEV